MDKAKTEAALARLRAHIAELTEDADTLEALLLGQQTPAEEAKALLGDFVAAWTAKYRGSHYVIAFSKELPQAKRLLKALPFAELSARLREYLKSPAPFHVNARHPFLMFAASVNEWRGLASTANPLADEFLWAAVADCRHSPACRSDQEHTKKRAAELRA